MRSSALRAVWGGVCAARRRGPLARPQPRKALVASRYSAGTDSPFSSLRFVSSGGDDSDDGGVRADGPRNASEALAWLQREALGAVDQADAYDPGEERIVHVGIIGEPNVGKSSLLNLLVNSPVSAVSPKRNTTRDAIVGVHMHGSTQIVFHDTPGFMKKEVHREFFQPLQKSVVELCHRVDVILLVVDAARRLDLKAFNVVADLGAVCSALPQPPQVVLVLNKVDLVDPKEQLLVISETLHDEASSHFPKGMLPTCYTDCRRATGTERDGVRRSAPPAAEPIVDSAEEEDILLASIQAAANYDGVQDVVDQLLLLAKPGDWEFDPEEVTDLDPQERALEAVKEAVFQLCQKELPYLVTPQTIDFAAPGQGHAQGQPGDDRRFRVRHRLEVQTKSHARILSGSLLNAIRRRAEGTLENALGAPVSLDLTVRVVPKRR